MILGNFIWKSMGHKSNHLLQFKQNSLGAAVILILTSLAYKKKINDGSIIGIQQSVLLGCVFLLSKSSNESISLFTKKKIFSQHQLHSMKAKVLMEIGFGHEQALFSRSCLKISDPVMQVNILRALVYIFEGAPAAQWMIDNKSIEVPERIWSYKLNSKEKKVLKRLEEYWSLDLDGTYSYQDADHNEDLLPDDLINSFPDLDDIVI